MREIRFRGKEHTGRWVYGGIATFCEGPVIIQEMRAAKSLPDLYRVSVDPNTVGQYTGVRDAHARAIYEGDILASERRILNDDGIKKYEFLGEVIFEDAVFKIKSLPSSWIINTYRLEMTLYNHFNIIGNIYDNPELLQC